MLHISNRKTSFFERFLKAQESYNIFPQVVSKFTLKIPVDIFAYFITKRDVELYYFVMKAVSLNYRTVFINKLSLKTIFQLLSSKNIYTSLKLTTFFRERGYGRDETFVTNMLSVL